MHLFVQKGMGCEPFKFDHFEFKTGVVCEICGHSLKNVYYVKSADGRLFSVGADCIRKTVDFSLKRELEVAIVTEKKAYETKRIQRAIDILGANDSREELKKQLAPDPWRAQIGVNG